MMSEAFLVDASPLSSTQIHFAVQKVRNLQSAKERARSRGNADQDTRTKKRLLSEAFRAYMGTVNSLTQQLK